jgi:hypothetical protein
MKSGILVLLTAAWICVFPASASAQSSSDWIDIKDPTQLRALHSNKTFRGNGWSGHYRADGNYVFVLAGGEPRQGTWEVKGNDRVCTKRADRPSAKCWRYQSNRGKPDQFAVIDPDYDNLTRYFTVEDGIPKF